jgi:hypothetical protein
MCVAIAVASTWAAAPAARAQGDDPRAIAEALFRSGRELMAAGDLAQACAKFAESNRIDPKPGTLMNLALCHEKAGRTASAWAEYIQAAEVAHRAGQDERERVAEDRARSLEAALAHLVIVSAADPATTVRLDERRIGPGAFGTAIPVDPGDHVVDASARGHETFTQTVTVAPTAERVTVRIPPLPLSTAGTVPAPRSATMESARSAPGDDGGASGRTWGVVSGGAGLVLLGIGGYFGLRAFSEKRTAEDHCGPTVCDSTGLDAITSMKTAEAVSTISMAVGVVGVGVGIYLVVSPPHGSVARSGAGARSGTLRVGPDAALRGVRLAWTW